MCNKFNPLMVFGLVKSFNFCNQYMPKKTNKIF